MGKMRVFKDSFDAYDLILSGDVLLWVGARGKLVVPHGLPFVGIERGTDYGLGGLCQTQDYMTPQRSSKLLSELRSLWEHLIQTFGWK